MLHDPTVGEVAEAEVPDPSAVGDSGEVGQVPPIGEEDIEELAAESLFDPAATSRIILLWIFSPTLSVIGSYLVFAFVLHVR